MTATLAPNTPAPLEEQVYHWLSDTSTAVPSETTTETSSESTESDYNTAVENSPIPVPPPRLPQSAPSDFSTGDEPPRYTFSWNSRQWFDNDTGEWLDPQDENSYRRSFESDWGASTENQEGIPPCLWHPDPYLTGLYQDQGVQTEPEVVSCGVQTNLVASRTEEDVNQLVTNLPDDFWDEYLPSPPTSTCEDPPASFDDCRSPDCH